MRKQLYHYRGTVSSIGGSITQNGTSVADITLHTMRYGNQVPPVRIEAIGAIAEYILDLENTDDEERYIEWDWYYTQTLYLVGFSIPSNDPRRPAKVIAYSDDWFNSDQLHIFGVKDHILTCKPDAMSNEEYDRLCHFRFESFYSNYSRSCNQYMIYEPKSI